MNAETLLYRMLKGGVGKRSRDEIGTCIAQSLRRPTPYLFDDEKQAVTELRERGFATFPPLFTPEQIQSIHAYFKGKNAIFYDDHPGEPNQSNWGKRFAEWPQEVISACPEFAKAAHDPRLLRIAEAYLEAPPLITILTAWWSFPSNAPPGGMQYFHHDRDDFRCLKLFVYLTDVTEETGPHQYVDCTHTAEALGERPPKFWEWMDRSHRKSDLDVREILETVRTITGPAGSTFLEDTRGLHRGVPPTKGPRLAFEICYTLRPKHNGKYQPIAWEESNEATRLFYAVSP